MTSRILKTMLCAGAALLVAGPALAQAPAVTVTGTPGTLQNPPFTLGYAFTTSQVFTVSGLGVFDADSDGLVDAHDVGLWNEAGTLLASTTVGTGNSGSLVGGFRFASVSPFTLLAGSYRVGALFTTGNDQLFFPDDGTVTPIPGVTYTGSAFAVSSTLSDPTTVSADGAPAYIGGNVLLGAAAVPEPASWALMIGGFGLVGAAMRRRTRVSFRYA